MLSMRKLTSCPLFSATNKHAQRMHWMLDGHRVERRRSHPRRNSVLAAALATWAVACRCVHVAGTEPLRVGIVSVGQVRTATHPAVIANFRSFAQALESGGNQNVTAFMYFNVLEDEVYHNQVRLS